jgi:hypothetical protein
MTFYNNIEQYIVNWIMNSWTIMIILAVVYKKKIEKWEPLEDERTKMINYKSFWFSWFISFLVLNIFFWVDKFSWNIDSNILFWILSLTMIFSFMFWKIYYNFKS